MSTEEGFLKAIIAEPDEDAHRLIYADWLEENGQAERGEFIRLQCRLAKAGPFPPCHGATSRDCDACQQDALKKRERELLEARAVEWFSPCLGFVYLPVYQGRIQWRTGSKQTAIARTRRGFVEQVELTADNWLAHADALRAATPLREVELTTRPGLFEMQQRFGRPFLQRVLRENGPVMQAGDIGGVRLMQMLNAAFPGLTFTLPPADPYRSEIRFLTQWDCEWHETGRIS